MPPSLRRGVRRLAQLVPSEVLDPIPRRADDAVMLTEYSHRQNQDAVAQTLRSESRREAYTWRVDDLDGLVMERFGGSVASVLDHGFTEEAFLRCATHSPVAPSHLRRASSRRYARLNCTIVHVGGVALLSHSDTDDHLRGFIDELAELLSTTEAVVFLDAPIGNRRRWYTHAYTDPTVRWLTTGSRSAALNWFAESDGAVKAESVAYALRFRPSAQECWQCVVVDGLEHCSARQQYDLLQWIRSVAPVRIVLGGNDVVPSRSDVVRRSVPPWTRLVRAAASLHLVRPCSGTRCWAGGPRLRFLVDPRGVAPLRIQHQPRPARWLAEEVAAGRIDPTSTVLFVSGREERERVLRQLYPLQPTCAPPQLLDGAPWGAGCVLRVARTNPDLMYGGVYHVTSLSPGAATAYLVPEETPEDALRVAALDVANVCVLARFAFHTDMAHHHYRETSVVILASRSALAYLPHANALAHIGPPGRVMLVVPPGSVDLTAPVVSVPVATDVSHALWRDVVRFLCLLAVDNGGKQSA